MSETNGAGGGRKLAVYAVPETKDGDARTFWPKIGVAFTNRDGSIAVLLDALPLGTHKLQIREPFERGEARPPGPGGAGRRTGAGPETVEARP